MTSQMNSMVLTTTDLAASINLKNICLCCAKNPEWKYSNSRVTVVLNSIWNDLDAMNIVCKVSTERTLQLRKDSQSNSLTLPISRVIWHFRQEYTLDFGPFFILANYKSLAAQIICLYMQIWFLDALWCVSIGYFWYMALNSQTSVPSPNPLWLRMYRNKRHVLPKYWKHIKIRGSI